MKRILSFILLLVMVLSLVPMAGNEMILISPKPNTAIFQDVKAEDWYYGDVMSAYEMKLIDGKTTTSFLPNDNMTYAEAIKLAACMHQLYTAGSVTLDHTGVTPWYNTYVEYCKENGIISKEYNYGEFVTRAGYMEIFAKALPDEALKKINSVPDGTIPDVASENEYAEGIYKLYRAGILGGVDAEHNCAPETSIKRCEVAVIVSRMMLPEKRISFTTGDDETIHTFAVFSDVHNAKAGFENVLNNIFSLTRDGKDLDGLFLVGDIVYYANQNDIPSPSFYDMINANEKYVNLKSAGKLAFAMGNHEFPINGNDSAIAEASRKVFVEQVGQEVESHHVFEGIHVITAGPNNYKGELTAEQEQYVIDNVNEALKDGEDKPIFLLIHHPVDGTLYGSGSTRHSEKFENFVKSQPRLIVISGHMHYPTSDPRSILQIPGGSTFIYSTAIVGGNRLSLPTATERHDKSYPSQGIIIKVNSETSVVTLKRFYVDSNEPTYLEGGDWTIDISAMVKEKGQENPDKDVYKYTNSRKETSKAPVFAEGAALTVTKVSEDSVTISCPATLLDADENNNAVYHKLELIEKKSGKIIETRKLITDYFLKNKRTAYSYSFFGLEPSTEYTCRVTPSNAWYIDGETISVDFTTLTPKFAPVALDESNTVNCHVFESEIDINYSDLNGGIKVGASASGNIRFVANIKSPGKYRLLLNASGTGGELEITVSRAEVEETEEKLIIKNSVDVVSGEKVEIGTKDENTYKDVVCLDFDASEAGDYVIRFKKRKTVSPIGIKGITVGKHAN